MYTREQEIRKLTSIQLYELAQILELNESWKKLMRIIPKNAFSDLPEDLKTYKYNLDQMRLIESASKNQHRMAAEILFEEWGTSGRIRPNLGVLLQLLVRAELFRAADLVAIKYLSEPPPERPSKGPAAKIDISIPLDSEFVHDLEDMLENGGSLGTNTINDNAISSPLADNNMDHYEKYMPNDKRFSIPRQPNGIDRPSTSNVDNNSETPAPSQHMELSSSCVTSQQDVIPNLSELNLSASVSSDSNNASSELVVGQESSTNLPILSTLDQQSSMDLPILSTLDQQSSSSIGLPIISTLDQQSTMDLPILSTLDQQSSMDLPILSAFNTQSSEEEFIPNLSALNVHDTAPTSNGGNIKSNTKPPDDLSPSMQSSSSASTISSTSDDGDDEVSAPNLSLLDQRSSNNDSSLTNVTATSEDNSFEISLNEGSTSVDNIPCLSALK